MVTILAVLLENSGLMKSGNKGEDFEYAGGQTVTFEDVHGIDEQKLVFCDLLIPSHPILMVVWRKCKPSLSFSRTHLNSLHLGADFPREFSSRALRAQARLC